jgi:hypothetical protein
MSSLPGIAATLATLAAGLVGGLALTASMLDAAHVPGASRVGSWTVWPRAGAADADPYTRAFFAKRGEIAMSPAEGLAFHALQDAAGRDLTANCTYRIAGRMPPARIWTLAAYRPDGSLLANTAQRHGLTSFEAVGGLDADIVVSGDASPGNWLPLPTGGRFVLLLRLYDTPLAAVAVALDPERLPRIERLECRS